MAVCLIGAWLIADPRTPDLAAQVYRVDLFRQLGFLVWDERWYAGHDLPGYSLLFPPLGALLGVRVLGAVAVLSSTALFGRLIGSVYGPGARWGAVWFAVGAVGDVWAGRVAFALGVPFALAAVWALMRGRTFSAGVLAGLCAAASPVAGALLGLAGLTGALGKRSPRVLWTLAGPPAVVVLGLALLFPEGGVEPYPTLSFGATALVVLVFLWALPASERLLRIGGLLYLLACVLCLLIHSPIGSNIERYGALLAGPLLVCARLAAEEGKERGVRAGRSPGMTALLLAGFCLIGVWVVWGPVRETLAVAGNQSTRAAYYVPLERFLARIEEPPAQPVRVEAPLTRSHWEAALLAPSVSLARGWDKQLDSRFDGVLLRPGLTAAGYWGWLREEGVGYVALADTPLDPSSAQEGRLIRRGLPYLRAVFRSRHWRVFKVLDATALLTGPGRLSALGHDSFSLRAFSPGSFLVRVRFSRYLTVTQGVGCVARAPGGWTEVQLSSAGAATVTARFSLGRAFGSSGSCGGSGSS